MLKATAKVLQGLLPHVLDVLHQEKQVKWIGRARFEFPVEVPLPGCFILGMHQQRADMPKVEHTLSAPIEY